MTFPIHCALFFLCAMQSILWKRMKCKDTFIKNLKGRCYAISFITKHVEMGKTLKDIGQFNQFSLVLYLNCSLWSVFILKISLQVVIYELHRMILYYSFVYFSQNGWISFYSYIPEKTVLFLYFFVYLSKIKILTRDRQTWTSFRLKWKSQMGKLQWSVK